MIRDGFGQFLGFARRTLLDERVGMLVLATVAVLLVAPPPSPVHVSFVTSDSMQPSLAPDDGYFVVDGTTIDSGDVITFYSDRHNGYVTHRVVEVTDEGYVTQGDNNPSPDQAAGVPPVDQSQVLGEVLAIDGRLLVVPGLGAVAQVLSTWWGRLAAAGAASLWYLGSAGRLQVPRRPVTHVRDVVIPTVAVLALAGLFILVLSGTTHVVVYDVIEGESSSTGTVTVGDPSPLALTTDVYRPPLTTVITETDGMVVANRSVNGSTVQINGHVPPPSEPGRYEASVVVQPYPSSLPRNWLQTLHQIHPMVAMTVSITVAFAPPVSLYALLFDGRTPIRRPNWRWLRRLDGDTR